MGLWDGLGWGVGGQIVKQIRRGGGNEQEVKKTEKGEMRPRRRKIQYGNNADRDGRGCIPGLAPLLCS